MQSSHAWSHKGNRNSNSEKNHKYLLDESINSRKKKRRKSRPHEIRGSIDCLSRPGEVNSSRTLQISDGDRCSTSNISHHLIIKQPIRIPTSINLHDLIPFLPFCSAHYKTTSIKYRIVAVEIATSYMLTKNKQKGFSWIWMKESWRQHQLKN